MGFASPKILFVPVSGPKGIGEYMRCTILADAMQAQWPGAEIHFILNRHAPYAAQCRYPVFPIDDSPTLCTAAVQHILRDNAFGAVVFDNAGRTEQLQTARESGAKLVYISRGRAKRRKAFRYRWLPLLHQHWLAYPLALDGQLSFWERWKLKRFPQLELVELDSVFTPSIDSTRSAFLHDLGLEDRPYVLVTPGGGGRHSRGADAPEIFLDAAHRIARETDRRVVYVAGPGAPTAESQVGTRHANSNLASTSPDRPLVLDALPHARMIDLIHDAEWIVGNGGSMVTQFLAHGKPCISVPVSPDQPHRVRVLSRMGCVATTALDADAMIAEARRLIANPQARTALADRARSLGVSNGTERALRAVERLLAA